MLHIYNSVNRDIYEKYLMQFCEYAVTSYLDTAFGGRLIGEPDRKMIIRILKCELFGAYIEWVSMGMPRDAINEVSRMLSILHGLSEEIILRCRQDGETPSVLRDVTDKG